MEAERAPWRIAITAPAIGPDDVRRIRRLLEAGWQRVHLRWPDAAESEVARVVEAIPAGLRPRLTLHDHFGLLPMVGGAHLSRRHPELPARLSGEARRRLTLSASCHTADEVRSRMHEADYVTFSPVFESVSKPGYGAGGATVVDAMRSLARELPAAGRRCRIIGLGGITPSREAEALAAGFDGVAVLGTLFGPAVTPDAFDRALEAFCQNE